MAIRFTCSHCNRSLTVKDELAGKRGRCPYCKQVIVVPASRATAPVRDPRKPDVESLALAALGLSSGETVTGAETVAPGKPTAPIQVTCSWCDHQFEVEAALAGKQTPCPECRRIVRVPTPHTPSPRDWRQAARTPSAAVIPQQQLEGEWGTATARSHVSQEALEEAAVLPVEREPLTPGQWATRIGLGLVAVAGLYVGYRWWTAYRSENRQNALLTEVQQSLQSQQSSPEQAVAVRLGLVRYWQNAEPERNRVRGVSRTARNHALAAFQEIRKLAGVSEPAAHQVYQGMLVEYVAQCCAAGLLPDDILPALEELSRRADAEVLLRQTVHRLADLTRETESQRRVLQRFQQLLERAVADAPSRAKAPALPNRSADLLAVAAQELAGVGATDLAQDTLAQLPKAKPSGEVQKSSATAKPVRAAVAEPVSLQTAIAQLMVSRAIEPGSSTASPEVPESASAWAQLQALARSGRFKEAMQHWQKHWPAHLSAVERWPGFQVLAECALRYGEEAEVRELLRECLGLAQSAPPRILPEVQLMQIRLATAANDQELAKQILEQAKHSSMRRWLCLGQAETAILRARGYLPPENIPSWQELAPGDRAYLLSRLAWHNARQDRQRCQRWADSLQGGERAIVAAVLLAHESAAATR